MKFKKLFFIIASLFFNISFPKVKSETDTGNNSDNDFAIKMQKYDFKYGVPQNFYHPKPKRWGYADKDKSLVTKTSDFFTAGASLGHSIIGNVGNFLGQGMSLGAHGLGTGFKYLGNAIDESDFQTKESLALSLGYSLAAWIGYKYYNWRNDPQSRSLFTFLIPDWVMRAVGNK